MSSKVVIITGASSGIGKATAHAFSALGWKVVIAARKMVVLGEVAAECRSLGAEVLAVYCDVSREDDCKKLIRDAVQKFGRIDVLVNNAGISMRALFADCDMDVIRQLMDINFWGTVYCTKHALPFLLQEKGSVIGVSSVAGLKGLPARTGYSASKFAMKGFMEALRTENLKTGLHVGVICPGYTTSNIRNTALGKDGTAQSETPLDESKLMPAQMVADEIVQMALKRKAEVVLTTVGKLTAFLNKFFPRWMDKQVFRVISREKDSPFR